MLRLCRAPLLKLLHPSQWRAASEKIASAQLVLEIFLLTPEIMTSHAVKRQQPVAEISDASRNVSRRVV